MPTAWTELRAAVDPIVRPYNLYSAYPLDEREHIGAMVGDVEAARELLVDEGYEPQYLSAAKRHLETDQLHDLSYRRVPSEHPAAAAGTRLTSTFEPAECQHHIHVFDLGDVLGWFIHYEARPDFLEPSVSIERLQTHYRPVWGQDYLLGNPDFEVPDVRRE